MELRPFNCTGYRLHESINASAFPWCPLLFHKSQVHVALAVFQTVAHRQWQWQRKRKRAKNSNGDAASVAVAAVAFVSASAVVSVAVAALRLSGKT